MSAETNDLLSRTLQLQKNIQDQLMDLEACSQQNNICIHGVPEGAEGDTIQDFVEKFNKTQLCLPDIALSIQRCHRSLGPKPLQGPRLPNQNLRLTKRKAYSNIRKILKETTLCF